jgi:hypothetical protein
MKACAAEWLDHGAEALSHHYTRHAMRYHTLNQWLQMPHLQCSQYPSTVADDSLCWWWCCSCQLACPASYGWMLESLLRSHQQLDFRQLGCTLPANISIGGLLNSNMRRSIAAANSNMQENSAWVTGKPRVWRDGAAISPLLPPKMSSRGSWIQWRCH